MCIEHLPGEIISQILGQLSFHLCSAIFKTLDKDNIYYHYFYHRLNEHIKYGGADTDTHRSVTHEEFLKILYSDHRPKSIIIDLSAMYKPSFEKFLTLVDHKEVLENCGPITIMGECSAVGTVSNLLSDLSNIQKVLFVGDLDDAGWTRKMGVLPKHTLEARFRMSKHPLSYTLPKSLKVLDLTRSELIIHHDTLPPKLEELILFGGALKSDPLANGNIAPFNWSTLPHSIKKLEIQGVDNADLVAFPPDLEELSLGENDSESLRVLVNKLPKNLNKLRIFRFTAEELGNDLRFPDSIQDLSLDSGNITELGSVHWPAKLKKLNLSLNYIVSLKNLKLPSSVESIDVSWNSIESLADFDFPPSLKEFKSHQNLVNDWTQTVLPSSLEYLTLGSLELFDLIKFPAKLHHLSIHGHFSQVADLKNVPLSLKSLEVNDVVFAGRWEAPPNLKKLKIVGEFTDVKLPEGLRSLEFNNYLRCSPTELPDSITEFEAWTPASIYPKYVDNLFLHEVSETPIQVPISTRTLRVYPIKTATIQNVPRSLVRLEGRLLKHPPLPEQVRIYLNSHVGVPQDYKNHPLSWANTLWRVN